MDLGRQGLSIEQAKNIYMVIHLSAIGFEPPKTRNHDYWYISPFCNEETPSFKIIQKLHRWYDHGISNGSNLGDVGISRHGCTIAECFQDVGGYYSLQKPAFSNLFIIHGREDLIKTVKDFLGSSCALLNYLPQRYLPIDIADRYCHEVRYELWKKIYDGTGCNNDLGGFKICNPYFRASSSRKGITSFDNNADEVVVFEGFTDFLSFKAVHQKEPEDCFDIAVLNSIAFFETARPFMEKHKSIRLFLDRDSAGQNCSCRALFLTINARTKIAFIKMTRTLMTGW